MKYIQSVQHIFEVFDLMHYVDAILPMSTANYILK